MDSAARGRRAWRVAHGPFLIGCSRPPRALHPGGTEWPIVHAGIGVDRVTRRAHARGGGFHRAAYLVLDSGDSSCVRADLMASRTLSIDLRNSSASILPISCCAFATAS